MNALLLLQTIAILCGPRVQIGSDVTQRDTRAQVKQCQVEMVRCVDSKATPMSEVDRLKSCMQEIK